MIKRILKISAAVLVLISLIFTVACSSDAPKGPATELELKLKLEKKLRENEPGDRVLEMLFGDYDGDGENEAFAFTGDGSEGKLNKLAGKKLNSGALWFVSRNRLEALMESSQTAEVAKLAAGKNTYCVYEKYDENSSASFVWRVKNGEPAEEKISGSVGGIALTDEGITAKLYAEDGMCFEEDGEYLYYGETEKPYYFYDSDDGIKEYGGLEISRKDLLGFEGAREILKEIEDKDNKVTTLFYRANGLININYRRLAVDEYICGNSTVRLNGGAVEKYRSNSGEYAPSATDNAVYPESLPTVS